MNVFTNGIHSKPPKIFYPPIKTDVYLIDEFLFLNILDREDHGPEPNRGKRYVLFVIDKFSEYGWTIPLNNKNTQTIKDSFENLPLNSK